MEARAAQMELAQRPADLKRLPSAPRGMKKKPSLPQLMVPSRTKSNTTVQVGPVKESAGAVDVISPLSPTTMDTIAAAAKKPDLARHPTFAPSPLSESNDSARARSGWRPQVDTRALPRDAAGARMGLGVQKVQLHEPSSGSFTSPWDSRIHHLTPSTGSDSISPRSQVPSAHQRALSASTHRSPASRHYYSRSERSATLARPPPVPAKDWGWQVPMTAAQPTFPVRSQSLGKKFQPLGPASKGQAHHPYTTQIPPLPSPDQWSPQPSHWARPSKESQQSSASTVLSSYNLLRSSTTRRSSSQSTCSSYSDATMIDEESPLHRKGHEMTVDEAIDLYSAGFHDNDSAKTSPAFDRSGNASGGQPLHRSDRPQKSFEDPSRGGQRIAHDRPKEFSRAHVAYPHGLNHRNPQQPPTSVAILNGDVFQTLFPGPPQLRDPTAEHDQYGFRKVTRDVTLEQYDQWAGAYAPYQARRTAKWMTLMREQGFSTMHPTQFPKPSAKVQRYMRKGLPPAWRGEAWFAYAGGPAFLWAHPGHYAELVLRSQTAALSRTDRENIERDLHRTFPENVHFKPPPPPPRRPDREAPSPTSPASTATTKSPTAMMEPPLLSALRRVLAAFALDHPRIGYCQSLNFIAGMLLLFMPEERAFWMLHIITTQYLPGTHDLNLEGANVDLWVLMLALKDATPALWERLNGDEFRSAILSPTPLASHRAAALNAKHVRSPSSSTAQTHPPHPARGRADAPKQQRRLPPISLCTTSWFMSLFIGTLPVESVLRVWDVLFYEGARILFRVALAIFRIGEPMLGAIRDPLEIFQAVQALPRRQLDISTVLDLACTQRHAPGTRWIERRRCERRDWYKSERAGEKVRKQSRAHVDDRVRIRNHERLASDVSPTAAVSAAACLSARQAARTHLPEPHANSHSKDHGRVQDTASKPPASPWWPRLGTRRGH